MQIYYSSRFRKSYKGLPAKLKELAEKKEKVFVRNPFDRRLKTHKLKGDFDRFLAFSVNRDYRIIFDFLDKNTIRMYDIGTHEIYK